MKYPALDERNLASAVALIAALAVASLPAVAGAQQYSVTVAGRPLNLSPGPIERAGRVFVPLRGIFERLGSTVVYQAGTINATRGRTTVTLHIGSTQALVDGQRQYLDVAPFIVGATTYVPLRFVAQSFGANVGYDANARVVAIVPQGGGANPPVYPPPRPVYPPPNPYPPANPVQLRAQEPSPGTRLADRFTRISAEFTRQVQSGSVVVRLDGNTVTSRSGVSSTGFSYKPPAPLDFGEHAVRVTGRGAGGAAFDRSWTFTVIRSLPPAPGMRLTISAPSQNEAVGRTFVVQGNSVANARIVVTAGATPSAAGQFRATTTAGPRGNFKLGVTLTTGLGQQSVTVRIAATDPATSRTTQTTLQLRLNQ